VTSQRILAVSQYTLSIAGTFAVASFSALSFSYCVSALGVFMIFIVVLGNLDGVDGLEGAAPDTEARPFLIGEDG
jgi:hypothetical protein